jgi:hypothetical protein
MTVMRIGSRRPAGWIGVSSTIQISTAARAKLLGMDQVHLVDGNVLTMALTKSDPS